MAGSDDGAGDKAYQEGQKLVYDALKHLTTLSTGSILLLVTFLERLFRQPLWPGLVAVSLAGFVTCVVASVLAMFVVARSVLTAGSPGGRGAAFGAVCVAVAGLAFLTALGALVGFALKNL